MCLDNIAIVLVEPQIPENIGAAARAMCNMGLNRLILINPKNEDPERIKNVHRRFSSHHRRYENIQ